MLLLLTSQFSQSGDLEFKISEGIESTDNIDLVPTNETRETTYTTKLGVAVTRDSHKLNTQIEFENEYKDYQDDTFDDENVPSLKATADWRVAPERFAWFLQDIFTQEQIDDLAAGTPNNEQDVNSFTTGPNLFFRLTPTDAIKLEFRYTDSYFEESDEDSTRYSQSIGWQHMLASLTSVSLNLENAVVEFDNEISNDNFDRQDAFVRWETKQARNLLELDIGVTSINRDRGEDEDESLVRFSWNRQLSARSNLDVTLTREISDAGRDIAISTLVGSGQISLADSGTGDVFTDKRLDISYFLQGKQTAAAIDIFSRNQDFQIPSFDEKERGIGIQVKRNMARKLTLTVFGNATRTEFLGVRRTDKDTEYGIGLSFRLGKHLSLNVGGEWSTRDSDDPSQEFREKKATLQIAYN